MTSAEPFAATVVLAAVWLFVVPLLTAAHELGHAAATLSFTDAEATVIVGGERWRWTRGRLSVRFDPGGWRRQWYGFCRYGRLPDDSVRESAVHLAGPAASVTVLAVVSGLAAVADGWRRFGLYAAFWWTAFQIGTTLVPIRYPSWWGEYAGHPSDGLQAWRSLAGES